MITVGTRMQAARESRGWTRSYVARKLKVTHQTVMYWETDVNAPADARKREVALLLGLRVEDLIP